MNYYYDLPDELIKHIKSFMKITPEQLQNFIDNPPKYYKEMLKPYTEKSPFNIKWLGSEERIDEHNIEVKIINSNLIKFFVELNIKKTKNGKVSIKRLKKYNLVEYNKHNNGNLILSKNYQRKEIQHEDHPKQFDTYDKKTILISSPYGGADARHNHIEHGYILYDKPLYNKDCDTYYIIID